MVFVLSRGSRSSTTARNDRQGEIRTAYMDSSGAFGQPMQDASACFLHRDVSRLREDQDDVCVVVCGAYSSHARLRESARVEVDHFSHQRFGFPGNASASRKHPWGRDISDSPSFTSHFPFRTTRLRTTLPADALQRRRGVPVPCRSPDVSAPSTSLSSSPDTTSGSPRKT
jgi:hypothetical protein